MNTVFALMAAIVIGRPAAPPPPVINPARTVVISGPIVNGNLTPLALQLQAWSAKSPAAPVNIVIDSPGGSVIDGFLFINQMEALKARGTAIRCWVPTIAASMAYQIFLHCSQRYTLDFAFLLWHRARVVMGDGPVTSPAAADLAADLGRLDAAIFRDVEENMNLDIATLRYHFERETLHIGRDLAEMDPRFVTSYVSFPGLAEAVAKGLHTQLPKSPFDEFQSGEMIYIWEGSK